MKPMTMSLFFLGFGMAILSCGNQSAGSNTTKNDTMATTQTGKQLVEEPVNYSAGNTSLKGYVAYDKAKEGKRPMVLVVPEWWGVNDYPRMRAKMLADLGYIAMAVDMYGDGKIAADPKAAQEAATPFYTNPALGKERLDAALAKLKTFAIADTSQVVAIGYCFGGSMVLNYAKMGGPVLGVVSFHGGLEGVPPPKGLAAKFLVCHGGADSFVPQKQVDAFKKSMDSAGATYTFKVYDGATHAFTNPNATATGAKFSMPIKYNGTADTASWNDMKTFFGQVLH